MPFTTKILDESHVGSINAVLEYSPNFDAKGGPYLLKMHRRFSSEDTARAAFAEAVTTKRPKGGKQ